MKNLFYLLMIVLISGCSLKQEVGQINSYSIDFILRTCLYTDQWLHACVAIERAICTAQGIRFSKIKSKQIAKLVIIFLIIFNNATSIVIPRNPRLTSSYSCTLFS